MIRRERLSLFHIGSVGVIHQASFLYGSLDKLVDRHIHIKLQKGRNLNIEFRTNRGNTVLKHPVVEEHRSRTGNLVLVFDDAARLNFRHSHMHHQIIIVHPFTDKLCGADFLPLHLSLRIFGKDTNLQIRQFVEDILVLGGIIGNVNISMLGSLRFQNLGAEPELIINQDVTVVNIVFTEIRNIVTANLRTVSVEVRHLIGNLIHSLHRFAQNDCISIKAITPAGEFPFLTRRFAEFFVRQLRICHA